jgi:hypothetical protein
MDAFQAFDEMFDHECGGKVILSSDNPSKSQIGWTCNGCGQEWMLPLMGVKLRKFPQWASELIRTPQGRVKMAMMFQGEVLIVYDETPLG